jgi:hypothetical protein
VQLSHSDTHSRPLVLTWEDDAGKLVGQITELGWLDALAPHDRQAFVTALTGLFQRAGVDVVRGPLAIAPSPAIPWQEWSEIWSPGKKKHLDAFAAAKPLATRAG